MLVPGLFVVFQIFLRAFLIIPNVSLKWWWQRGVFSNVTPHDSIPLIRFISVFMYIPDIRYADNLFLHVYMFLAIFTKRSHKAVCSLFYKITNPLK